MIEGSSHVFLTDAFRNQAAADIAAIRGFRYGTVVRPGSIRLEDLYHFIPIGPLIAKGTIKGKQLKNQIENSIDGSLNPDVSKWTGGWLFNFSGVRAEIDPYGKAGERAKNIQVFDLTGKQVITEKTMQNSIALRIGTLPGGLYLIKITTRNGTVLSQDKFMKE